MNIYSRHSNSKFAHSFDINCLCVLILRKVSICDGWLLFDVTYYDFSIYTLKSNKLIKKYGKQNLSWNDYYFYSFTSIQNSKSFAKTENLNASTSDLIPKKIISKNSNITLAILHFPNQNTLIKLPLWIHWYPLFLMKPSDMLQCGSF